MKKIWKRSLAHRVAFSLLCVYFLFLISDGIVHLFITLPGFEKIEQASAISNIQSITGAVLQEADTIDRLCKDWAYWDDTVDFVQGRSPEYFIRNLQAETFSSNKINFIYITDASGKVLFSKAMTLETLTPVLLSPFPDSYLTENHPFQAILKTEPPVSDKNVSGIWNTDFGPLMVVARPILSSQKKGQVAGLVAIGRRITPAFFEGISARNGMPAELITNLDTSFLNNRHIDLNLADPAISRRDDRFVFSYQVFRDIHRQPAFVAETYIQRSIYEKLKPLLEYTYVSTALLSGITLLLLIGLMHKLVLKPIRGLTRDVWDITTSGSYAKRMRYKRVDEIGVLARIIDTMLETIESQHYSLEHANVKLQEMADKDPLTGILNRRVFDTALEQEWARMAREKKYLAMIICDVDDFKDYNDTYGHPEGDRCLIAIARTLDAYARRAGDVAARYGGEEFALILPDTTLEQASAIAEKINIAMGALGIEHKSTKVNGFVTLSMGVSAVAPLPGTNPIVLLQTADQALYSAKHSGKNMVMRQPVTPESSLPISVL